MIRKLVVFILNMLFYTGILLAFVCPAYSADKTLAILPFAFYGDQPKTYIHQGLKSMFASRLAGESIAIIPNDTLSSLLNENDKKGIADGKRAASIAEAVRADYAIFGSITSFGTGYSLDLSIVETQKGLSSLKRVTEAVDKEGKLITAAAEAAHRFRAIIEGKPYFPKGRASYEADVAQEKETQEVMGFRQKNVYRAGRNSGNPLKNFFIKPTSSHRFIPDGQFRVKTDLLGMDIGDLNNDGQNEFIIINNKSLFIYQKKGQGFARLDQLTSSLGEDYLKVSAGDADNNGKAEIYLVSRYGGRARTTVYEWDGKFNMRHRLEGHIRVVPDGKSERPVLLFQASKALHFFYGNIYLMNMDASGKPIKEDVLPGLKGVQFYTISLLDMDEDGSSEYICIDENSNLNVRNGIDGLIWKGTRDQGGTNNAIELQTIDYDPDFKTRIEFNIGVALIDLNRDGKKEIITAENIPAVANLGHFKLYTRAQLTAYGYEGTRLTPQWESGTMEYCVTGLNTINKTLYIAVQEFRRTNFSTGSGAIMWVE